MHSSLRILQITLIITQITTVKESSNATSPTIGVNANTTVASSAASVIKSSATASSSETARTSIVNSISTQNGSPMTSNLGTSVTAVQNTTTSPESSGSTWSLGTPKMSTVYSSSASDVSNASNGKVGVPSSTPPRIWTSASLKGRVSENLTTTGSQTIIVRNTTSITPSTNTNNTSSVASTKATTLSSSGLLTSQMQSMSTNYSLSSASQRGSTSSGPKQTLTTSLPVFTVSESVNWTDWSVDSSDCEEYCSEKGGTVTASRQCYSHSKKLEAKVCTEHDNSTKVVKCGDEHCPVSGKEAFGSSISTLAVSILLVMLSSTFVRD